jgi:hypothetical protein
MKRKGLSRVVSLLGKKSFDLSHFEINIKPSNEKDSLQKMIRPATKFQIDQDSKKKWPAESSRFPCSGNFTQR